MRSPPVEYQSTAYGAHAAQCGLGVVVLWAKHGARSSPRRRPGLDHTNTAAAWRLVFQTYAAIEFGLHGVRPVRSPPVEYQSTAYGAHAAQCGLGVFCCGRMVDALCTMPTGEGRPHQRFERSMARASEGHRHYVRIPCRAARALFAPRNLARPLTEHTLSSADLARGVVAKRGVYSCRRRRARLDRTNTATGRRRWLWWSIITTFKPRAARPARCSPCGVWPDRPLSRRAAQCALGVVVFWANAGRAPPHAVGRKSTAQTPRQVGGADFE